MSAHCAGRCSERLVVLGDVAGRYRDRPDLGLSPLGQDDSVQGLLTEAEQGLAAREVPGEGAPCLLADQLPCQCLLPPAPGASPRLGYVQTDTGRDHVAVGTFVKYALCPPATGKHYNASGEGVLVFDPPLADGGGLRTAITSGVGDGFLLLQAELNN